jgi:hypothetical protein
MRPWGKIVSGMMLVMAAGFALAAVVVPEERARLLAVVVFLTAAALLREVGLGVARLQPTSQGNDSQPVREAPCAKDTLFSV